ncbi:hypothetical protein QWZ13_04910 [Reinekea marina]|uniref:hypothetical protein n=1 Tax=Reinekea marina TaxID=1310421 RepID=UPI0025B30529|nr:hypothetical protein [Reinekea marina]MDN3648247.1 hypothetical protein [Reinekea marina]
MREQRPTEVEPAAKAGIATVLGCGLRAAGRDKTLNSRGHKRKWLNPQLVARSKRMPKRHRSRPYFALTSAMRRSWASLSRMPLTKR